MTQQVVNKKSSVILEWVRPIVIDDASVRPIAHRGEGLFSRTFPYSVMVGGVYRPQSAATREPTLERKAVSIETS